MGFWENLLKPTTEEERLRREKLKQQTIDVREAELQRQEQDLVSLQRGGIPIQAQERLRELTRDDAFTSNLAPDELALLRSHGWKARGLVTASAMFHVGVVHASVMGDSEASELSDAYGQALLLASQRMKKELTLLGGHGVIGVRLNIMRHEWSEKSIEVQLVGTAVETSGAAPREPWLSDLSGQEWFALHRAGYEPVGLVWGHSAWFILTTYSDEQTNTGWGSWSNQEITHWSGALKEWRNSAMNGMKKRIHELGGTGVVGVKISRKLSEIRLVRSLGSPESTNYEREHHLLLLSIIGTALKPGDQPPKPVQQTITMLSLRDGRIKPAVVLQGATLEIED